MTTITRRANRTKRLAGTLAALALIGAGCAGDETSETSAEGEDGGNEASEADVEFVQGMIPHHAQAVAMAGLVDERTDRDELQELANEIESSQSEEIEQMTAILDRLDAEPMDGEMMGGEMDPDEMMEAMADMSMGNMDMDGMMSGEQMEMMGSSEGEEFEARFLEGMIAHHEGAITSAQEVLDEGSDEEVAELAEDIIAAQEAEIEQMTAWQDEWDLAA